MVNSRIQHAWTQKDTFPFLETKINGITFRISNQHPESVDGQYFYNIALMPDVWHPATILEDRTDPNSRRPITDLEEAKFAAVYMTAIQLQYLSIHFKSCLKENTIGIKNGEQIAINYNL